MYQSRNRKTIFLPELSLMPDPEKKKRYASNENKSRAKAASSSIQNVHENCNEQIIRLEGTVKEQKIIILRLKEKFKNENNISCDDRDVKKMLAEQRIQIAVLKDNNEEQTEKLNAFRKEQKNRKQNTNIVKTKNKKVQAGSAGVKLTSSTQTVCLQTGTSASQTDCLLTATSYTQTDYSITATSGNQTDCLVSETSATQTDFSVPDILATHIDPKPTIQLEIDCLADLDNCKPNVCKQMMNEHNYMQKRSQDPVLEMKKLQCEDCGFIFARHDNLKTHRNEHCRNGRNKVQKDIKCSVCGKFYTHNGLRSHLNNFVSGKHVARNGHQKFSPEEHKLMLLNIRKK